MTPFLFAIVNHLKYFGIFLGALIEGPAVGLITGLLVKLKVVNLLLAYLMHVSGDFVADCFYYLVGYHGGKKFLPHALGFLKFSLEDAEKAKRILHRHPKKIIILGKITHVLGFPILIGMGLAHYPWYKFILFNLIATLIKSAILVFLGYYFASLWMNINNIFSLIALFGSIFLLSILGYIAAKRFKKYYEKT